MENGWYRKFLKPLPKYVLTRRNYNAEIQHKFHAAACRSTFIIQATYLTYSPFARQINAYGLNGAINGGGGGGMGPPRTPGAATTNSSSHPRSSAGEESDEHDYYNDFDRLKVSELHFHQSKCPLCNHGYF